MPLITITYVHNRHTQEQGFQFYLVFNIYLLTYYLLLAR